jgi:nucleotide-binding universal stress UspA family protein
LPGRWEEALFERILVALDPARRFGPAREYAIDIVKRWGPSVVALYTAFEEAAPFKAASSESVKPKMFMGEQVLEQFRQELAEAAGDDVDYLPVKEEGPYEVAIPAVAAREGVDLIVLGSFHTGVERVLVGSDTERIIEYSPCSIMLVRHPSKLPEEGSVMVFAHDSLHISDKARMRLAALALDFNARVQPVIGVPPKGLEDGKGMGEELVGMLDEAGIDAERTQVLTSRWILGPHGVVHRAVAGLHPSLVVLSRYLGVQDGNATHWLVHEFVADTPSPTLFLK